MTTTEDVLVQTSTAAPVAACLGAPTYLFFPVHHRERTLPSAADQAARAIDICSGCPIRQQCYDGAVDRQEPWGVWGGVWFDVPPPPKPGYAMLALHDNIECHTCGTPVARGSAYRSDGTNRWCLSCALAATR